MNFQISFKCILHKLYIQFIYIFSANGGANFALKHSRRCRVVEGDMKESTGGRQIRKRSKLMRKHQATIENRPTVRSALIPNYIYIYIFNLF